jgi:hypothetical protein
MTKLEQHWTTHRERLNRAQLDGETVEEYANRMTGSESRSMREGNGMRPNSARTGAMHAEAGRIEEACDPPMPPAIDRQAQRGDRSAERSTAGQSTHSNSLTYGPLVLAFVATLAAAGSTEAHGQAKINGSWSSHWEYTFDDQTNEIRGSDRARASAISSYMDRNPSLRIGLDGSAASRVEVVRAALIMAGVPASKIQSGVFRDLKLRRDGRVTVLIGE